MRVLALLSVLLLVAVSVAQETNELEDMDDLALSVEEDDSDGMDAELDKIDAESTISPEEAVKLVEAEAKALENVPLQHEGSSKRISPKFRNHRKLLGPRRRAMEAAKVEEDWIIRTNKIIDITKKELPALTDDGFKIVDVPRELLGALREAYENGLSDKIPEHERFDPLEMGILPVMHSDPGELLDEEGNYQIPGDIVDLTKNAPVILSTFVEAVQPLVEKWVGVEAEAYENTMNYGVRSVTKGAIMRAHTSQINSQAVTVLVQLGQKGIEEQWTLRLKDHGGKWHNIYLKPGQMLFYESAKLVVERPYPFKGESMANFFAYFAPVDWMWKEARFTGDGQMGWTSKAAFDEYVSKRGGGGGGGGGDGGGGGGVGMGDMGGDGTGDDGFGDDGFGDDDGFGEDPLDDDDGMGMGDSDDDGMGMGDSDDDIEDMDASIDGMADLNDKFASFKVTAAEQALLKENGIETSEDLKTLTMEQLREVGLKMGTRNRILRWAKANP